MTRYGPKIILPLHHLPSLYTHIETDRQTDRPKSTFYTTVDERCFLTLQGIRTQKCADVNLTRALRKMLPWKQVADIEMYNTNKTRFAYCNTGGCSKVNDSRYSVPIFWNRLQVNDGSLLLTGIEENDNGLEIKVTVHLNASPDETNVKKAVRGMQTVRVYTLKILVLNSSQGN